jgi:succinyl-diaminopimelate desuccinylase
MKEYSLKLAQKLLQKKSITPEDDGAIDLIQKELDNIGFKTEIMIFSEDNQATIKNLYAKYGDSDKNLAFAGHTDVVPIGDIKKWNIDPFKAEIIDNKLYARGAVDMKPAITSFIAAVKEFLSEKKNFQDSISFIITGDEEGIAVNGTAKMVNEFIRRKEKFSHCIVGEPTNPYNVGEMIKIGRRGSINFNITVIGTQGHVAYPHNADNPNRSLVKFLHEINHYVFDKGNDFFQATNLEVTSIDVNNKITNIIPEIATAKINIRFNNIHTGEDIVNIIQGIAKNSLTKYELDYKISGESFFNHDKEFIKLISDSIEEITGKPPELSTNGGTSDARFIKKICPTIEFGLINETAHKINEYIDIDQLEKLDKIYLQILRNYFK